MCGRREMFFLTVTQYICIVCLKKKKKQEIHYIVKSTQVNESNLAGPARDQTGIESIRQPYVLKKCTNKSFHTLLKQVMLKITFLGENKY